MNGVKEAVRDKVMALQKKYGLPFKPNQPLHEVLALIKIQELKKQKEYKDSYNGQD